MRAKCTRCRRPNDWLPYCKSHPVEARKDCAHAFDGYCSAICQALDLRASLIEEGRYDAATGVLI